MSKTFSIHTTTLYKSDDQCYIKVLCLDRQPDNESVLNHIVKRVKNNKLSTFKQEDDPCIFIIMNPTNLGAYAQIDNIQIVFSWLIQRGFTIDTNLTQMFLHGDTRTKNTFICFIHSVN